MDLGLVIVGEGDARSELETTIAGLKRTDRIKLLGYRPDMLAIYEAMDTLVLNSLREGLPNVVLEAMAMEVPVVATRIAGIPRLIEHNVNGLLLEPGDSGHLERSLRQLLDRPGQRRELAAAGRTTIEQSYSFAARMSKVRAVYDDVLGTAGAASLGKSPPRCEPACTCPEK